MSAPPSPRRRARVLDLILQHAGAQDVGPVEGRLQDALRQRHGGMGGDPGFLGAPGRPRAGGRGTRRSRPGARSAPGRSGAAGRGGR